MPCSVVLHDGVSDSRGRGRCPSRGSPAQACAHCRPCGLTQRGPAAPRRASAQAARLGPAPQMLPQALEHAGAREDFLFHRLSL